MNAARDAEPLERLPGSSAPALVMVPVYNEAANVVNLINAVLALPQKLDVLIVDDNSPDGTSILVREHPQFFQRVFLLQRTGPKGFAGACRDGLTWGSLRHYPICVQMDADFSHDPTDIPRLLAEIANGADLVVGSRYVGGVRVINWPAHRLLVSLFAGFFVRFLIGLPLRDPTSGFKAVRNRVLRQTDWAQFTAEGYGFQVELHFHAFRNAFHIVEMPIVFTERTHGASKMSVKIAAESAVRVLSLGCSRVLHRRAKNPVAPIESLGYA
jgi:dolichol-phosphate mannosyltransferase